jgi:hypothetical protein
MKMQCNESSKDLLHLLDHLVSDSQEPYNGIVWQLICCPFTPFLTLFGEILSNASMPGPEESKVMLSAIERFPIFLKRMGLRNSLALKLERVAVILVKHARSVVYPLDGSFPSAPLELHLTDMACVEFIDTGDMPAGSSIRDSWALDEDFPLWESIFPQNGYLDTQSIDLSRWTNDILGDGGIDWIGDSNIT